MEKKADMVLRPMSTPLARVLFIGPTFIEPVTTSSSMLTAAQSATAPSPAQTRDIQAAEQFVIIASMLAVLVVVGAVLLVVRERRLQKESRLRERRLAQESALKVERERLEIDKLNREFDKHNRIERQHARVGASPEVSDHSNVKVPRTTPPAAPEHIGGKNVPPSLVSAIADRMCVLFVGPGLSTVAGYPSRRAQAATLLQAAGDPVEVLPVLDADDDVRAFNSAVESLDRDIAIRTLSELFGQATPTALPEIYKTLGALPFRDCITTSIDGLMEAAFSQRDARVVDGMSLDSLESALARDSFSLIRLSGSLGNSESLRLSSLELRRFASRNPLFSKAVASAIGARTVLFLGMTGEEIQEIFLALPDLTDVRIAPSYAVVPRTRSLRRWQRTLQRYNIKLLPIDTATQEDMAVELDQFTIDLSTAVEKRIRMSHIMGSDDTPPSRTRHVVALTLSNIGPFEDLRVELDQGWNVILGDNGVGKTTVLRAIALVLCGDAQASSFAGQRLLRTGATTGRVELQLDDSAHQVTLSRLVDGTVHVNAPQFSAVQQGDWLVMGFPALRGIASGTPSQAVNSSRAQLSDLLPLLSSMVDPRLEDLKQWIINLQSLIDAEQQPAQLRARYRSISDAFFAVVVDMFPGLDLQYASVDPIAREVYFKTQDGRVSIEQLSQGTMSLLAWVGVLLQRMYDVYANSEEPREQTALVLIDELEAHLHPEWQRQLVDIISHHFPNLQIIATSHSPLIVASLTANNILIAYRDKVSNRVVIERSPIKVAGRRPEDLLTSGIFGLPSLHPPKLTGKLDRLDQLQSLTEPDSAEREEITNLNAELGDILAADQRVQPSVKATDIVAILSQIPLKNRAERITAFLDITAMSGSKEEDDS